MSEAKSQPDDQEATAPDDPDLPELEAGFKYRDPNRSRYYEILRDGDRMRGLGWNGDFLVSVSRIVRPDKSEENLDLDDTDTVVRGSCGRVSKTNLKERLLDGTYEVGHGSMTDRIEQTVDRSGRRG